MLPNPRLRACLLALLLPAVAAAAAPARVHRYQVAIDADYTRIRVHACFDGVPGRLVAASLDAAGALREARWVGARRVLEPNGPELRLPPPPGEPCLDYAVEVAAARRRHERTGTETRRLGRDLVTDLGAWLWRPEQLAPGEDLELVFDLPPGIAVSAPWPPLALSGEAPRFRVGPGPADWPATVAFGRFREQQLVLPGGTLRLAVLDGRPPLQPVAMAQWLEAAGRALCEVSGRLPRPSVQVLVWPGPHGEDPVPMAYVLRGGAPALHLMVDPRHDPERLRADWSAAHELSHLLLPQLRPEDAWASEGLASYYQVLLRARAGLLDPARAWEELHRGFASARSASPALTLAQSTQLMHLRGAYRRVYWEGAALWLLADHALRVASGGSQSLDSALAALQACCLDGDTGWSAAALYARLDALTGTASFSPLLARYVESTEFPDLDALYGRLGIAMAADGMHLVDGAVDSPVRDAIMAPTPHDPSRR